MTTLFLGILSIIQSLFIPGFLISLIVRQLDVRDRLILSIPLSIIINYVIVIFLISINSYNKESIIYVLIFEFLLFLILYKKNIIKYSTNFTRFNKINIPSVLALIVLYFCISSITQFINSIGSVFTDWDAIVSYNRWARDWAANVVPGKTTAYPYGTYSYPQAIPIIYSISYVLTENNLLEQFPKIMISIFPLAMFCIFFRLFSYLKDNQLAVAWSLVIFFGIFSTNLYKDQYYTGYIEPVIMFYGLFIIYSGVLLENIKILNKKDSNILIIIIFIAASGVALIKQHGILLAYGFPLLFFINSEKKINSSFRLFILIIILISVIVLPWYVYKLSDFIAGTDSVMLSFYTDFNDVEKINFIDRPLVGMKLLFGSNFSYILLLPFIIGFWNKIAQKISIYFILPYYLIWSLFLIYNVQNISIILPAISLVIGYGMQKCSEIKIGKIYILLVLLLLFYFYIENKYFLISSAAILILIVIINKFESNRIRSLIANPFLYITSVFLLIIGIMGFSGNYLSAAALSQNFKIGNAALNEKLKNFIDLNVGKVATSYQMMGFIPSLADRFLLVQCSTKNQFLSGFAFPEAEYYLVSDWCHESVKDFMKKATMHNHVDILFDVDGFIMYRVVDERLKLFLSKTGRLGLDRNLNEALFFLDTKPYFIRQIYKDNSIDKIEFKRNNLWLSGKLPQFIDQHRVDWVITTIGGNVVLLTETSINNSEKLNSLANVGFDKMVDFSQEIPFSVMKKLNGPIRLFAVAGDKLYELSYANSNFFNKQLSKKINIIFSEKKLYLKNDEVDIRQLDL